MGLCRCPQRKVSTLFCFKHHVNVCESCLVNDHPQCTIRSYISWLQDNDYDPNCSLCHQPLAEDGPETVRLLCYELFHWSCLDQYFRSFPSHTAPDGYTCPSCHICVFPPPNLVSPVADCLRKKLNNADWATRFSASSSTLPAIHHDKQQNSFSETENNGYVIVNSTTNGANPLNGTNRLSHNPHRANDPIQGTTIKLEETDPDEDKYKRRNVLTWLARWLRSRQVKNQKGLFSSRTTMSRTRYTVYMIFIILFIFLTILIVLYHLTRGDDNEYVNRNDDSQFNPLRNPFIRVGGQFVKKSIDNPSLSEVQSK